MNELLMLMVQVVLLFLVVFSVVTACRRVFVRGLPPEEKARISYDLKGGALAGMGLAIAQGVFVALVLLASGGKYVVAINLGVMYFVMACLTPVLWAGGRVEERRLGLPKRPTWGRKKRLAITAAIWLAGVVGSLALFLFITIKAGFAVEEFQKDSNNIIMGLLGLWMILNAPWMEELLFRHAVLPQFANWMGGSRDDLWTSAAVLSIVFAAMHAGNMDPLWAKLVQTFFWGLGLAWTRIYLGTPWAIGLHMAWNIASIGIAQALMPEGPEALSASLLW